jgi:hypothetical protein
MDPRYETDPIRFPTAGDNQVPKPTVRRFNAIGICTRSKQTSLKAIIQSIAPFPIPQYARAVPLGSLGAGLSLEILDYCQWLGRVAEWFKAPVLKFAWREDDLISFRSIFVDAPIA